MPQAGLHGLTGMAVRKWMGKGEWLLLGVILGTMVPDMDNVAVAIATLMKRDTHGLHRTFTHNIFFIILVVLAFQWFARIKKQERWGRLGYGLGIGILMHILLDLVGWFNGVAILWPINYDLNFWTNVQPPEWFMTFMEPAELLMFGIYLYMLGSWARKYDTNQEYQNKLRNWMILEFALFIIFAPLAYIMTKGFLTIFGAVYLFSLFMTFFVTIRMRETINRAA